jgi:O-methyltransferase
MKRLGSSIKKRITLRLRAFVSRYATVPGYYYMFTPRQLAVLCQLLDSVNCVSGVIIEIGCAWGWTTIFLNRHMRFEGLLARPYYCVDTFRGFLAGDTEYEYAERGKRRGTYENHEFSRNSKERFELTLAHNALHNVTAIQADASTLDYSQFTAGIALCLLDVDLYMPTIKALPNIYRQLSPGGIIVIDDCIAGHELWDGAYQAYVEFCALIGQAEEIIAGKLGVIRK